MMRYGYIHQWRGHELYVVLPMRRGWLFLSVGSWLRFGRVRPPFKPWVTRWYFGPLCVEWQARIKESSDAAE